MNKKILLIILTSCTAIINGADGSQLKKEAIKQAYYIRGDGTYPPEVTPAMLDQYNIGYSIQELLDHGFTPTMGNLGYVDLSGMRINSLIGFENILDHENIQILNLGHNLLSSLDGMPTSLPKLRRSS